MAPDAGASGEITITVPAGVAADADGNPNTASAAFAIAIASVWDPLTGFTLFDNAAGGADVQALSDGTVLRGLVSGQLNVRADTRSGAAIGSVRMALSGAMSSSRTEGTTRPMRCSATGAGGRSRPAATRSRRRPTPSGA